MTDAPNSEERHEAQLAREAVDRVLVLERVISYAQRHQLTAVELVEMADALELTVELEQLTATSAERQHLLVTARLKLRELRQAKLTG